MKKSIGIYKELRPIGKGASSTVFLGINKKTKQHVAIKKVDIATFLNKSEAILRFKREAEIIAQISHPFVIEIYEMIEEEDCIYLIMEYFDGDTLKNATDLNFLERVEVIKNVADTLSHIHSNNIVHMDLKPSNILVKKDKKIDLRIIDFGLAYLMNLKDYFNRGTVVGSFNYISPEQTGVLRRPIDNRSDLYSLGVTFYEILTGRVPFRDNDLGKLIHKHLALRPERPSSLNNEIPPIIDEIILKLLNKEPGDRYQTADGLKNDLEMFLSNPLKDFFEIGTKDKGIKINFAIKMVGREDELSLLENKFSHTPCIVFVQGDSGTGKTKLLEAFTEKVINEKVFFYSYQCSHSSKNIPYTPFTDIVKQVFEKGYGYELRTKLQDKLGKGINTLAKLCPFIKKYGDLYEGKTDDASEVKEKETLFQVLFDFLVVIASDGKLFLQVEDLQWADQGTLDFIKYFINSLKSENIFLVTSFRTNELTPAYLFELGKSSYFEKIDLQPLKIGELVEIVKNILNTTIEFRKDFYDKIYINSLGNAFFIFEIIKTLSDNSILYTANDSWEIDYEELKKFEFKQNISDLLLQRLKAFNDDELYILKCAAIIGRQFNLSFLEKVVRESKYSKKNKRHVYNIIIPVIDRAITEQLIEKNSLKGPDEYLFLHDRIYESLYASIEPEKGKEINLICAQILEVLYPKKGTQAVFTIAYFYNKSDDHNKKLYYNWLAYEKAKSQFSLSESIFYSKNIIDYHMQTNSFEIAIAKLLIETCVAMQQAARVEESFSYLNNALVIAQEKKWEEVELKIYLQLGTGYYFLNDTSNAFIYYDRALNTAKEKNIEIDMAIPNINIGSVYYINSEYERAEYYLSEAIKQLDENDSLSMVRALGLRSWGYINTGDFDKSRADVISIENRLQEIKNPITLSGLYHICSYYYSYSSEDPVKALSYSNLSYEIAAKSNHILFQFSSLCSRMKACIALKNYDKAIEAGDEALEMSKKHQVYIGIHSIYVFLIESYIYCGDIVKAFDLANKVLADKEKIHPISTIVEFIKARAIYYYFNNEYSEALKQINEALQWYDRYMNHVAAVFLFVFKAHILNLVNEKDESYEVYIKLEKLLAQKQMKNIYKEANELINKIENYKFGSSSSTSYIKEKLQIDNIIKTSQMISSILDIDHLLEEILDKMQEVTGAERGALLLYNEDGRLEQRVVKSYDEDEDSFSISNKIIEKVIENKRGLVYTSDGTDTLFDPSKSIVDDNIRSIICVPLVFEERLIGVFYLDSKLLNTLFAEEDLNLLKVFTTQAAISIENARRNSIIREQYEIIRNQYNTIKKQFHDSIQIITSLIAKTSSRLYEYTQQVSRVATLMAKKVQMSIEEIDRIHFAALLHDLGMIGVVEKKLYNVIILSDEEEEMLKQHPVKSVDLIDHLYGIDDIKQIIYQHHERYNGTGYPKGIKGENIILGARIIGLVDDFVMMLQKREFQTVDKKEKIVAALTLEKGGLYDPGLVDTLLELIEDSNIIYVINEKDIAVKKVDNTITWEIPSNLHFETIIVGKIMDEIGNLGLGNEIKSHIDYSIAEVIRNAIIHGNKYNQDKKVTISSSVVESNERKKLLLTVVDEGDGMDSREHNRFSESRNQLLSIVRKIKDYENKDSDIDDILKEINNFKDEYYSDFNTFRQVESKELTGGLGLLYVKKTFDTVNFSHILKDNKICGTKVIMELFI